MFRTFLLENLGIFTQFMEIRKFWFTERMYTYSECVTSHPIKKLFFEFDIRHLKINAMLEVKDRSVKEVGLKFFLEKQKNLNGYTGKYSSWGEHHNRAKTLWCASSVGKHCLVPPGWKSKISLKRQMEVRLWKVLHVRLRIWIASWSQRRAFTGFEESRSV